MLLITSKLKFFASQGQGILKPGQGKGTHNRRRLQGGKAGTRRGKTSTETRKRANANTGNRGSHTGERGTHASGDTWTGQREQDAARQAPGNHKACNARGRTAFVRERAKQQHLRKYGKQQNNQDRDTGNKNSTQNNRRTKETRQVRQRQEPRAPRGAARRTG